MLRVGKSDTASSINLLREIEELRATAAREINAAQGKRTIEKSRITANPQGGRGDASKWEKRRKEGSEIRREERNVILRRIEKSVRKGRATKSATLKAIGRRNPQREKRDCEEAKAAAKGLQAASPQRRKLAIATRRKMKQSSQIFRSLGRLRKKNKNQKRKTIAAERGRMLISNRKKMKSATILLRRRKASLPVAFFVSILERGGSRAQQRCPGNKASKIAAVFNFRIEAGAVFGKAFR